MLIKPIKPFFQGHRQHAIGDPPFEVEDQRGQELVKAGFAQAVVKLELGIPPVELAVARAPAAAEQAVTRRQKRA